MHTCILFSGSWCSLMAAIIFGVLGTLSLKFSASFHKVKAIFCMGIFYSISFVAMTSAIQTMDISVVYAIWSGVGTILVTILGAFLFKETISWKKAFFLFLIVVGIIGIPLANVLHFHTV